MYGFLAWAIPEKKTNRGVEDMEFPWVNYKQCRISRGDQEKIMEFPPRGLFRPESFRWYTTVNTIL